MTLPTVIVIASLFLPCGNALDLSSKHVDKTELERVELKLEKTISELSAMKNKCESGRLYVAFMAQVTHDVGGPLDIPAGVVRFSKVIFNEGNGYDSNHGVFTAPSAGVYLFSAQMFLKEDQSERFLVDIKVNDQPVSRMAVYPTGQGVSGSTTVIVSLKTGDKVLVNSNSKSLLFWDRYHTFFSGSLLH